MGKGPDVFIIQALSLLAMIVLFGFALAQRTLEPLIYSKSRSTASAFWFFFAAYACLFFVYVWMDIYAKSGRSLTTTDFAIGSDVLGNISNVCFLFAAVAYCRGRDFNAVHAIASVVLLTMVITIWAFGWNVLVGQDN